MCDGTELTTDVYLSSSNENKYPTLIAEHLIGKVEWQKRPHTSLSMDMQIYHDAVHPSAIFLPVISGGEEH
jgi:predicted acyl esterase